MRIVNFKKKIYVAVHKINNLYCLKNILAINVLKIDRCYLDGGGGLASRRELRRALSGLDYNAYFSLFFRYVLKYTLY